jgi:hypothetical protein
MTPYTFTVQIPDQTDVAAALAAMPSFVAAVAKAMAPVVVAPPPVTSSAPVLKVVWAQNGATPLLPQDYSYSASDARADIADGGDGNPACIKITVTAPYGGFQPSDNNGITRDWTGCTAVVVSVKSTAVGIPYSMQFLQAGDIPIPGSGVAFTSTKANVWERFSFDPALLFTDRSVPGAPVDVRSKIYKGAVQFKTGGTGSFLIDNWGGV